MSNLLAPANVPSLGDIQGNILKGHGRRHSALVLFRFGPDRARNRALLRAVADPASPHAITTARQQHEQANTLRRWTKKKQTHPELHREARTQPFRSLGLTSRGLEACGWDQTSLAASWGWSPPGDFWAGMSAEGMLDPEPWRDRNYQLEPHGVWILAHEAEDQREQMIDTCRTLLEGPDFQAKVTGIERGQRWTPHPDGVPREPFGFMDGFARTRVAAPRSSGLRSLIHRGLDGMLRLAKPYEIPLGQVVLEGPGKLAGSSFLVLRKLEQNVQEFLRAERELRPQLVRLPADFRPEDPGALFIGRNRNGQPLVVGGQPRDNLFHFGRDQQAARCPFHAHIRKMNLRQNTSPGRADADRTHQKGAQFVRRGMVYGDKTTLERAAALGDDAPDGGLGLLFVGYMSDIARQFFAMHMHWALDNRFPTAGEDGTDPLFNLPRDLQPQPMEWTWPAYDLRVRLRARFVTPVGGAYFFVPSLRWLKGQ